MNKIECLVWNNDLARGEQGNALVSRYLEKACNLIEAEINEAGGIAGRPFGINHLRVPRGEEGVERVLQALKESPDILFLNYHTMATLDQKILESIDLDTYLYFKSGSYPHPNLFNISRTSQVTKVRSIQAALDKYGGDPRILFFHDGRRG